MPPMTLHRATSGGRNLVPVMSLAVGMVIVSVAAVACASEHGVRSPPDRRATRQRKHFGEESARRDAEAGFLTRHPSRQKLAREFGATDIVTERGEAGGARVKGLT